MKIAIDISPMEESSGHKIRGVGNYVENLTKALKEIDKVNSYIFFAKGKAPQDADLVHYPYFEFFFHSLPLFSKKKTVVTIHDVIPLIFREHFPSGIKGKFAFGIQKFALSRVSGIITDSECSKRDIVRILKFPETKVKVVYLATDPAFQKLNNEDLIPDTKRKFSLPENFLLYVGDATWNKNLPKLIDAVSKTSLRLVLVGKVWENKLSDIPKNPWNDDLVAVFKRIENDSQFIPLGFVPTEDLVRIYNLATCLVLPSIYEGFGLPVLEAMQSGCPVVCSNSSSLPEIAQDSAVYFDPQDIHSMKDTILKVLEDSSLRKKLSQEGLKQAKKFSWKKAAEQTIKAYEEFAK
ncbi:MAG: glycosyltransferase family 1 protein [bacterium]|nr:glycosyltransferase family 1 protein [bacterium]